MILPNPQLCRFCNAPLPERPVYMHPGGKPRIYCSSLHRSYAHTQRWLNRLRAKFRLKPS